MFINFILATLIVFAFFFDIWELIVFILFAVFVVNWQPAISVDIVLFGVIPLAAYAFHRIFAWTLWAGIPVAIVCGFLLLYVAVAPGMFLNNGMVILIDMFGGLVFGGVVSFILK